MLELKNVTKVYLSGTKKEALKQVSTTFDSNGFVSILGPSGCGKTTLLNLIGGLDDITSGSILVNNEDIKSFSDSDLDYYRSSIIGFIFQNYNLINELTIYENISLGLDISSKNQNYEEEILDILKKFNILDLKDCLPNEISGGQQQRVAIARAIMKKPKILLCDEPTGALDSETSEDVMNILKAASKECLVIMVTHNEVLAHDFSDRIISMKDGKIVNDTKETIELSNDTYLKGSSKMPLKVSHKMAIRNIIKKKKKNLLITLASCIGIIGLAIIIGISNGFNNYLKKMETDSLSKYPIQISSNAYDFETILASLEGSKNSNTNNKKYPTESKIFVTHLENTIKTYTKDNDITTEYMNYLDKLDSNLYNEIMVRTNQDISMSLYSSYEYHNRIGSIYDFTNNYVKDLDFTIGGTAYLSMLPSNEEFLNSQYDCIYGHLPTNKNEMVIIVDEYNQLDEVTIHVLGLSRRLEDEYFKISELVGTKYSLVLNNDRYEKISPSNYMLNNNVTLNQDLEVVGVIRPSKGTNFGMLKSGLGYTKELYNYVNEVNYNSDICSDLRNTPQVILDGESCKTDAITTFGASLKTYSIKIYAKDDSSKAKIESFLDLYNEGRNYNDQIVYTDLMSILTGTISSIVKQVSYILYAFVSLSLIVSSIMIGVITYSSIVERTREIGILRSLGAKRKDVEHIFNTENIILGLISGVLGVLLSLILGLIVNAIIENNFGILDIFSLKWYNSAILIGISILLSFAAGAIPAYVLSKKKPVTCIRSE